MNSSTLSLIWANKPGCSRAVAEIWIGDDDLWFVVYVDEEDASLKIEVFPIRSQDLFRVIDFVKFERLVEYAKRDLLVLASQPKQME